MCGRYSFTLPPEAIRNLFRVLTILNMQPRYNIAPTQDAPVIGLDEKGQRALKMYRWALVPRWAKDDRSGPPLINARADSIADKPSFKESFARRRCLVLADGFYEWLQTSTAKPKPAYRIECTDRPAFAFAGIWDAWKRPNGEILRSFAIVTTDTNDLLRPVHDRMPVILPQEAEDIWLSPESTPDRLKSLLVPYDSARMRVFRVSERVNSVKNDDLECIAPLQPTP